MTRTSLLAALLLAGTLACSHSVAFTAADQGQGEPFSSVPPVRMTYNPADNYWPSWTQDGGGILYAYSFTNPDSRADDRCLGLLRPGGGTQLWQLCDDRGTHADSADSFAAADIDPTGQLIYLEASSRRGSGGLSGVNPPPQVTNLWLADTVFPFQRRLLAALPVRINNVFVNWFRDTRWTGPTSFLTLAQLDSIVPVGFGSRVDSLFIGLGVVRGDLTASGATFTMIPGTEGTQFYSFAENNASLVIWRTGLAIEKLPLAGGTPVVVGTIPNLTGMHITGLTCQGSTCLVGTSRSAPPDSVGPIVRFFRMSLGTGESTELAVGILDSPRISPRSTDVIGRDSNNGVRALYLHQGLLP